MKTSLKPRLTLKKKRSIWGYIFTAPFSIGVLLFFLKPMAESIKFALNDLTITNLGFNLEYVGLDNFRYALGIDPDFVRVFTETVTGILVEIPSIIVFSFFAANLLNKNFRGRTLARVIFFLPVILTSGIIFKLEAADILSQMRVYTPDQDGAISGSLAIIYLMLKLQIPNGFIAYIINAVNQIPEIINASAIPILIFLSGLQGIPASLYESAKIEGATGWECFWKVTFPLMSPLFITNIVYIVVDSFTAPGNELVNLIGDTAWLRGEFGASVAMTWLYFAVIALFLAIIFAVLSRRIIYMEE